MSRPDLNAVLRQRARGTGNMVLVLHEVAHALEALAARGEARVIDLSSLPMTAPELDRLTDWLGRGEVIAQIEAEGRSEAMETAYPGVWLVTHRDRDDMLRGRYIEITPLPEILRSQPADIAAAGRRMARALTHFSDLEEAS